MDEVLVDSRTPQITWLRQRFPSLLENSLDLPFQDCLSESQNNCRKKLLTDGTFFENLNPMPESLKVVTKLFEKHEVFIVSAAMDYPNSLQYKYRWLKKNLPGLDSQNIVFCGDKSIVKSDFLIDDHAYNFKGFDGIGLLFSAPHNKIDVWPNRINNWSEIGTKFL